MADPTQDVGSAQEEKKKFPADRPVLRSRNLPPVGFLHLPGSHDLPAEAAGSVPRKMGETEKDSLLHLRTR